MTNKMAGATVDFPANSPAGDGVINRLRVLHVNGGNLYGGVETVLATVAGLRELCPSMEPHFALCYEGRASRELAATGVPLYLLGEARISRPWTVWRARRRLREVLRREHFHAVICHMPWAHALFASTVRAEGQKLGFWAHGFHTGRTMLELIARMTPPDVAIVNSRFTENGVKKFFESVPREVLYNPVALSPHAEASEWRTAVRQEHGASDDMVAIIQVSRLEEWKGHLLQLDALSQLKDLPSWVYWIVGGPQKQDETEYLDRVKATAARLGIAERVRFLGQRSDIQKLLAGSDIFCQPNAGPEPFGIVFIEALWAGLPVVTTAMGGALEIVDKSCGLLVEPANAASLARALRRLIISPKLRHRLARAGAARAFALCDPEKQIKKIEDLMRRIGAGKAIKV
jgi:glycosyltransferase involved in cell wall biosynthesis